MKTSELIGPALDWTVAKCEFEGCEDWDGTLDGVDCVSDMQGEVYAPSTHWSQGGPIIEQERICITPDYPGGWTAITNDAKLVQFGPTPLIAAMRCYVASKLGDTINLPENLT